MVDLINRSIKRKGNRRDLLTYNLVQNSTIATYGANDVLNIQTLSKSSLFLGTQNDTAILNNVSDSKVFGGTGVDNFTISYSKNTIYDLGGGNDIFTLSGVMNNSGFQNSINGGSGFDIMKLPQFTASITFSYDKGAFTLWQFGQTKISNIEKLELSNGVSLLLKNAPSGSSTGLITVNGSAASDTLYASSNSTLSYAVSAGDGDDKINAVISGLTTIDGGNGNDVVILDDDANIVIDATGWAVNIGKSAIKLTAVETIQYLDTIYNLGATGAKITSTSTDGGLFKGTSGTDTIIGTAKEDFFYAYGRQGIDLFDFSAGGKDTFSFNPTSYLAGTTNAPITVASVYGASKDDIFQTVYSGDLTIVSDTRQYTGQFATSGALQLRSIFAAGLTFQIDFIATPPI